jgi:hypothetical protein
MAGALPDAGWFQRAQPGVRIWRWQLLPGWRRAGVRQRNQQVYTQPLDDAPRALTQDASCRYGDVQWHDGQVLAVEERHAEQVEHRLVAGDSGREVLAEGADFYAAPTLSADGQRLAWIEWDRPHQPWTVTRLMCRSAMPAATGAGALHRRRRRIAATTTLRCQGRLYCLSDRNGFWQPWGEVDGHWQRCPPQRRTMPLRLGNGDLHLAATGPAKLPGQLVRRRLRAIGAAW